MAKLAPKTNKKSLCFISAPCQQTGSATPMGSIVWSVLSVLGAIAGAVVGWFATNFIAKPYLDFRNLRCQVDEQLISTSYAAIAAIFIAVVAFGGERTERATRAFVGSPQAVSSHAAADCRAKIPKGSTLGQAAYFVMTFCEDPDEGCRAKTPLEKMHGMTMGEAALVMLIRCGTRAELHAYFDRIQAGMMP